MILNLNELAIDFRKASIEELSYEAVEKFLEEVQKVYSYLNIDEQLAAEELWIGIGMLGVAIDTYHHNKFYPLVNLKGYLTESREHVKNLYGEIYVACYSHKTSLEDFASANRYTYRKVKFLYLIENLLLTRSVKRRRLIQFMLKKALL